MLFPVSKYPVRFAILPLCLMGCEVDDGLEYDFVKKGATVSQRDIDFTDCEVAAVNKVPPSMKVATTPSYTTPVTVTPTHTNCYGYGYSVSCYNYGGTVYGGQTYGGEVYSYDANQDLRDRVLLQCMAQKGWEPVGVRRCTDAEVSGASVVSSSGGLPAAKEIGCFVDLKNGGTGYVLLDQLPE